jgi:hypothetical protein
VEGKNEIASQETPTMTRLSVKREIKRVIEKISEKIISKR